MKRVAIIGAGACGLWCANTIKRLAPEIEVVIYERFSQVGKKILMSGNSKGNLTNLGVCPEAYNDPGFVAPIVSYDSQAVIRRLEELGLEVYADDHGRVYPVSESAASFVTLLQRDNHDRGVITMLDCAITDIGTSGTGYLVSGQPFDFVVLAVGSKAGLSPKLPEDSLPTIDGSKRFERTDVFPALSAMGVAENIGMLNGQRVKANLELMLEGTSVYKTDGELQFIEKALSGIAIFELSSFYARRRIEGEVPDTKIVVDVCPRLDIGKLMAYIETQIPIRMFDASHLVGLIPMKLGQYVHNQWRRLPKDKQTPAGLAQLLKGLEFTVSHDYRPINNQIFAGGIHLSEVDKTTLETHKYPNLFIGGEALNVDGLCGGYNLHFAFAAGEAIAHAIKEKQNG